ncbi:MAG: hypothetical protein IPN70_03945 [Candidatus Moraniibacteriota bacterium]|nr:MAG: hypothetical protein IPN70_03945 [Candidatus Moranbacteria bacterium]
MCNLLQEGSAESFVSYKNNLKNNKKKKKGMYLVGKYIFLVFLTATWLFIRPWVVSKAYESKDFSSFERSSNEFDLDTIRKEIDFFFLSEKNDQENLKEREQLFKEFEKTETEDYLKNILSGYPMEDMIPFLLTQDSQVMAFLVGIAKKESDWGKHVPVDRHGTDCYNYWGYKAPGSLGVQKSGYGCFSSPEEAISRVGERIKKLVLENKKDTPGKMVIWKCGSSCAGHEKGSVQKWIGDVGYYHAKILAVVEKDSLWKKNKT